jgi:hypothetical protein
VTYIPVELRRLVKSRAANCCEYCRLSQQSNLFAFHVEHIIATKHDGKTLADNLCLSCPDCNINKGSDIASFDPITGNLTFLFNPRTQDWTKHFSIDYDAGRIKGLTPEGRVTAKILKFNTDEQIAARIGLIAIEEYPCE